MKITHTITKEGRYEIRRGKEIIGYATRVPEGFEFRKSLDLLGPAYDAINNATHRTMKDLKLELDAKLWKIGQLSPVGVMGANWH